MATAVGLAFQNRVLKTRVTHLTALLYAEAEPRGLRPGDFVLAIDFASLDGRQERMSFVDATEMGDNRDILVGILAPWCPHCRDEVKNWNELYHKGDARLIGLSIDAPGTTRDFVREAGVQFPVYVGSPTLMKQFELPGIPALIRFSPNGRVKELVLGSGGVAAISPARR